MKTCVLSICLFFSFNVFANFEKWKSDYIKRAAKRGIPQKFSSKVLKDVRYFQNVTKKEKAQVLFNKKKIYQSFIKKWLREDKKRLKLGKQLLKTHHKLLKKVEKKYQVDKEVIVALWGVETFYGRIVGDIDLIQSLVSLAYKSRRKQFFEIQLNSVLRLLRKGKVKREWLKGSWAGATGQCQFMPSNIGVYGQDFDGDGKINLWSSLPDVFASIAYLLKRAGWKKGRSIGQLAFVKDSLKLKENTYYSKKTYRAHGLRVKGNWTHRRFSKIPMEGAPVVLRGGNYLPLITWNRSSLFVAFTIILADHFKN